MRRFGVAGMRLAIICVLTAVLAACSALRVAYNTGPQLAWWWIDGYFDFSREHAPQVKAAIEQWFDWHRASQLPDYAAALAQMRREAGQDTTAAALCAWSDRVQTLLAPATARALEHAADALPGLGEAQLQHVEQRYRKIMDEFQREYLQTDPRERLAASIERTEERAKQLYGWLEEAQRKIIAEGVAASPFDAQLWAKERRRRQQDTLRTLRRLLAEPADRAQRLATLRALTERSQHSPDAAYRAYQQRLTDYNCAFAARVHNASTPEQRERARATLKGYEDDVRSLITTGPG